MDEKVSEINNVIKDAFKSAFKSSLGISLFSVFILWYYIYSLGRQDIFMDSISSLPSLAIVFSFLAVVFFMFVILFSLPSIAMIFLYHGYESDINKYDGVKNKFVSIAFSNSFVFWFLLLTAFLVSDKALKDNHWALPLPLPLPLLAMLALVFSLVFSYCRVSKGLINSRFFCDPRISKTYRPLHKRKLAMFGFSIFLISPALALIFPLSFVFSRLNFINIHNDYLQFLILCGVVFIAIIFTAFPGVAYLTTPSGKGVAFKIKSVFLAIASVIFIIMSIFRPAFDIIADRTMVMMGIADWNAHNYLISSEDFSSALFPGEEWGTYYSEGIKGHFLITGVPVFSLNNAQLICPIAILNKRKASLHEDIDDIKNRDNKIIELKKYAKRCVYLSKNNAIKWDADIEDVIFYQKVKTKYSSSMLDILHLLK